MTFKNNRSIISTVYGEKGIKLLKKQFIGETSTICFQNEKIANDIFKDYPWMSVWKSYGENYFIRDYYEENNRLDNYIKNISFNEKREIARNILSIILELYLCGYSHRDLHARNIFVVNGQIKIIDFETMAKKNANSQFLNSYDLTGKGLDSPFLTDNMCYVHESAFSLRNVLGVDLQQAIDDFKLLLKRKLEICSQSFNKKGTRHVTKSGRIYSSFSIPTFSIEPEIAQRDNVRRLEKIKISNKEMKNKTILDLGCNTGGMLFELQNFSPEKCVGLEYDYEKIKVANRVAAFAGIQNTIFIHEDLDKIDLSKYQEKYDYVFCLSINAHVKDEKKLFKTLGHFTKKVLIFEGNEGTIIEKVKESLIKEGFSIFEDYGFCDDDVIEENNKRPIIKAFKNNINLT